MNFIKKLFGKKEADSPKPKGKFLVISLNDRTMPIDRGNIYEDPLDEILRANQLGEVTGGGTLQEETGEIVHCDVEVLINSEKIDSATIQLVKESLEKMGAPKGSKILVEETKEEFQIGNLEGIAFYLDGRNLPENVYKECDINVVIEELRTRLGDESEIIRYWESGAETALYFYAESFLEMKEKTKDFISRYPLCENARVEQIA